MDNHFEEDLDSLSDEALKYIGVTNLDFRTHLSQDELSEVQKMLFSINTLLQITFKDGTEVTDIENLKHLLELSPMCDDSKVEKMILRHNSKEEVKKILTMPYDNPDTWKIAYDIKDETYLITTIPNYRLIEEYINIVLSCIKSDMSSLEKIKELYDFVKLLEYDENSSSRLPDIVRTRKTNNLGYSILFTKLLERIDIKSFVGEIIRDGKKEYFTLVSIKDEKYDIDGIYAFDPASDSIPKGLYKSDAIRKINYNFLALPIKRLIDTLDDSKLVGTMSLFTSSSFDYFNRHLDNDTKDVLEETFDDSLENIYQRLQKTKVIPDDKIISLCLDTIHQEDFLGLSNNINNLLSNNYHLRKKEIFNDEEQKELQALNIHDI